jgi:hypothetical protein
MRVVNPGAVSIDHPERTKRQELFVFVVAFLAPAFAGTFFPALRASDNPIAIACLGLVTFWPLPERSFPFFIACISVSTDFEAAGLYLRVLFVAAFLTAFFAAGIGFFPPALSEADGAKWVVDRREWSVERPIVQEVSQRGKQRGLR